MVVITLKQLLELREKMTGGCTGSRVDIVIDHSVNAVFLQWKFWRDIEGLEFAMQREVSFKDIAYGRVDVLGLAAERGAKDFYRDVAELLGKEETT